MSITDELREWVHASLVGLFSSAWERDVIAIADRIDAAHAKAVERARMDGMDATFGDGWVKLPVDADGVPIHVGDELKIEHNGRVTTVDVMTLLENGWTVYCESGGAFDPSHTRCHHVKPDSWVRIIGDAMSFEGDGWYSTRDDAMAALVERCKRLAGEGE